MGSLEQFPSQVRLSAFIATSISLLSTPQGPGGLRAGLTLSGAIMVLTQKALGHQCSLAQSSMTMVEGHE